MTARSTVDTYFEAIRESHAALFEALTASIGRTHRLSASSLTEMERSQHELLELGRAFAAAPSELRDMAGRVQASAERGRERLREARRQWLDEFAEARKETLETFERVQAQQRIVADSTEELARGTVDVVIDRLQDGLRRIIEPTEAQHGARTAPQPNGERAAGTQRAGPPPRKVAAEARRKRTVPPAWLTSSAPPATAVDADPETPPPAPRALRGAARASDAPVSP
jgi:hypothetical protein